MQSRVDSFMETLVNIVIGLAIASVTNAIILPSVTGVHISAHQNLMISAAFTVVSLVRQFTLRRLFNGRSPWSAIKDKFNASIPPQALADPRARTSASGVPLVRRCPDVTAVLG